MQFTFKRDEEGRECIYVDDVRVADIWHSPARCVVGATMVADATLSKRQMEDAIERADEAGFWAMRDARSFGDIAALLETGVDAWLNDEVTVDVPTDV